MPFVANCQLRTLSNMSCFFRPCRHTHTHTHAIFIAIFPVNLDCPSVSLFRLRASFQHRPKLCIFFLTPFRQVLSYLFHSFNVHCHVMLDVTSTCFKPWIYDKLFYFVNDAANAVLSYVASLQNVSLTSSFMEETSMTLLDVRSSKVLSRFWTTKSELWWSSLCLLPNFVLPYTLQKF